MGVIHKSSIIFYRDLTPLDTMNIDRRKVFLFFIDPFYLKLTTYEIYLSTQQLMRLLPRQCIFLYLPWQCFNQGCHSQEKYFCGKFFSPSYSWHLLILWKKLKTHSIVEKIFFICFSFISPFSCYHSNFSLDSENLPQWRWDSSRL